MSENNIEQPVIPPRTYIVNLKDDHEESYDLEFTIVIKCDDENLHEHNSFWSDHERRLKHNDNDIVAVILKMIGPMVLTACHEGKDWIGGKEFGINSIFKQEGWDSDCFEITKLYFYNYIDDDAFEFKPVKVQEQSL